MRKGQGRLQQIRGQRRAQKIINRRLNRNQSDLLKNAGVYAIWLDEQIKKAAQEIYEAEKEKNESN
jgi:hypothetical protein